MHQFDVLYFLGESDSSEPRSGQSIEDTDWTIFEVECLVGLDNEDGQVSVEFLDWIIKD